MKLTDVKCPHEDCKFDQQDITLENMFDDYWTYTGECPACDGQIMVTANVSDPTKMPF